MKDQPVYSVYILASKAYGTLYVGVTNDLIRRVGDHKVGAILGFTKRYGVNRLVYYEYHFDIAAAISREKQLKRWRREWKISLIEEENPGWVDLYTNLIAENKKRTRWKRELCLNSTARSESGARRLRRGRVLRGRLRPPCGCAV
ncbi:MAG TPA: GIY-YIG nuclease family protein [Rhizomicrobium sp.]